MPEAQYPGVKKEPRDIPPGSARSVNPVAGDRMASGRHMDADLMRPPGMGTDLDKIEILVSGQNGIVRDRDPGLAAFDGELLPVARMAADRLVERSFPLSEMPPEESQVDFFHFPLFELSLEIVIRLEAPGGHDRPRRVAVEAMDDPQAVLGTDAADFRKMVQEGVDQGSPAAARAWMDEQAAGLGLMTATSASA